MFIYFVIDMKFNIYDSYLLTFIMILFIYEILNMKLDNYGTYFNRYSL